MTSRDLQEGLSGRASQNCVPTQLRTRARTSVVPVPGSFFALALLASLSTAQVIPSGGTPSPRFGALPFSQKLLLAEEFGTSPINEAASALAPALVPVPATCQECPDPQGLDTVLAAPLSPAQTRLHAPEAQQSQLLGNSNDNPFRPRIEELLGRPATTLPRDGRPPGEGWAHQRYEEFPPQVYFQSAQTGARTNNGLRDGVQRHQYSVGEFGPGGLYHNDGSTAGIAPKMHPNFPAQSPLALWTFDGTFPVKLLQARYGEAILFRHHNALPVDPAANMGFGSHTITTHLHNGHNPAESDGYMHAYFFPGQYYDFRWPMILAGHDTINTGATDPRAGAPDGNGGIAKVRGDWREMQSSLWFHDHMLDYTSQNVYKGNAAVMNVYSSVDRGNEAVNDGVNLRLPSGSALDWGNRDYDVNLVVADKAWDQDGQLWFNTFENAGFLGDTMTVNLQYSPYFEVRARRYRFRLLNGCVARYFKLGIVKQDGTPVVFHLIANDGNIMEHSVAIDGTLGTERGVLPAQSIAERYDIVVDFAQFQPGEKLYFVNLMEHTDGAKPNRAVPLSEVVNGTYNPVQVDDNGDGVMDRWNGGDPCVGKFMEMRVVPYSGTDLSMNPKDFVAGRQKMVPLPRPTAQELASARRHDMVFGKSGGTDAHPWTIKTNGGEGLNADYHTVAIAPQLGELQIWKFTSGGGWAHPVHVHFEEAMVLSRGGQMPPEWERWARKDVFRIGAGPDTTSEMEIAIRFREFAGSYVEHCHNTTHEDLAMLLRWDIERPGQLAPLPAPIPDWEGCMAVPSNSLPLARQGVGLGAEDGVVNNGAVPPVGTLQVSSAEYRTGSNQWRIKGRLVGSTGGAVSVRAYLGATLAGPAIGSAVTDSQGRYEIIATGPAPAGVTKVSFDATSGAVLLNRNFSTGN